MLSNEAIKEELKRKSITVDNGINNIENNGIKVTLGNTIKVYDSPFLKVTESTPTKEIIIPEEGLILKPGELYIARTFEFTKTYGFVPLLTGKEELAAIGMEIHVTAGFGDNGFEGTWTLEIVCANPIIVYPGMKIGTLYFSPLIGDPKIEYRGKYFRQTDATASRLSQEYSTKNEKNSTKKKARRKKC